MMKKELQIRFGFSEINLEIPNAGSRLFTPNGDIYNIYWDDNRLGIYLSKQEGQPSEITIKPLVTNAIIIQ